MEGRQCICNLPSVSARIAAMLGDILAYVICETTHVCARVLNKLLSVRGVYERYVFGHCRRNTDEAWLVIQIKQSY